MANGLVNDLIFGTEQVDSSRSPRFSTARLRRSASCASSVRAPSFRGSSSPSSDSTIALHKYGRQINAILRDHREPEGGSAGTPHPAHRGAGGDRRDRRALHVLVAGDGTAAGSAETDDTDTDVSVQGAISYATSSTGTLTSAPRICWTDIVFGDTDLA